MTFIQVLASVIAGAALGSAYGLLFFLARKQTFYNASSGAGLAFSFIYTLARFVLLAAALTYLLRTQKIDFILLIGPFVTMFWLIIVIASRTFEHEKR